jgi:hypothetical protein
MAGFNKASAEPQLFVPSVSIPSSRVSASGYAMANAQVGSKAPITVNNYGAPGQSAETLGRIVVDGMNFAQRVVG